MTAHPPTPSNDAHAFPSERYAWYVFAVLVATVVLAYIDRQIVALLVEPLRIEFELSDFQIGLLQGPAFMLFYAFAAIPLGFAVDRTHRRNIILGGLLLWSTSTVACAYAPTFGWLLTARVGVGLGEAALIPGVFSLFGDYFRPNRRPLVFSLYMTLVLLGASQSMTAGGWIVAAWTQTQMSALGLVTPWRLTFLSVAVPAPFIALLLLTVREPPRQQSHIAGETGGVRIDMRLTILLIAGIAAAGGIFQMLLAWLPTVLIREHTWQVHRAGGMVGMTITIATLMAAAITVLTTSARGASLSDVSRSMKAVRIAGIAGLFAAPAALCLAASTPSLALAATTFVSIGALVAYCLGPVILQAFTPNRAWGRVAAGVKLAESITASVGVSAVGALSDHLTRGGQGVGVALASTVTATALLSAATLLVARARAFGSISPPAAGAQQRRRFEADSAERTSDSSAGIRT